MFDTKPPQELLHLLAGVNRSPVAANLVHHTKSSHIRPQLHDQFLAVPLLRLEYSQPVAIPAHEDEIVAVALLEEVRRH